MEAPGPKVLGPEPRVEGKTVVVCGNPAPTLVVVVSVGESLLVGLVELGLPVVPVEPVVSANRVVGSGFPAATVASGTETIAKNDG